MARRSGSARRCTAYRHVLYAFDGPRMVLALDEQGRQSLGIAADEDDAGTTRWVFAPAPLKLEVSHREYAFDEKRLADAVDRTASTPRQEDDRPVLGTLIGLLPTDHRFEFRTEAGVLLKGKVARETDAESLVVFFQKPCLAHLRVITVERFGETAEAFMLVHAEAPPAVSAT
jgi:hypothetical protein